MRRLFIALLACVAALAAPAVASASPETLMLDTRETDADGFAGPVSTTTPLVAGLPYFAVVKGTVSRWTAAEWNRGICGTPDPAPMFPSAASVAQTFVGSDAETLWAAPKFINTTNGDCSVVPTHSEAFKIDRGTGTFAHHEPLGGPYSVPRPDHTYTYPFIGNGGVASFRFRYDDGNTRDNYGQFQIRVLGPGDAPGDVPPRIVKTALLDAAKALPQPSGKNNKQALSLAIGAIEWSLAPNLWQDDSHLTDKGHFVFVKEAFAWLKLAFIQPQTAQIDGIQAGLVAVDRALAKTEIDEAPAGADRDKALEFLAAGDALAAAGNGHLAILKYGAAWHHARKA
jgi:hypothetical protein